MMTIDDVRRRYGDWSAMSIHLGSGQYTLEPAVDGRLRRLLQIAQDLTGKPIAELRVLDLACLEGHYGIEFAMHGAEVVGIELREANLAKARFASDQLNLDRLRFVKDDVRNLSVMTYGRFDVVLCSGILYHLTAPDVFHFVRAIHDVCTRLVIIDTQVALRRRTSLEFEGHTYHGVWYQEHDESADEATKLSDLHASVENTRSFWFTPASLANLVARVGFTSFYECLNPHHDLPEDRRCYIAIKGSASVIRSSPITNETPATSKPEMPLPPVLRERGEVFKFAKRTLPKPLKDLLKPALRAIGLLPADTGRRWKR